MAAENLGIPVEDVHVAGTASDRVSLSLSHGPPAVVVVLFFVAFLSPSSSLSLITPTEQIPNSIKTAASMGSDLYCMAVYKACQKVAPLFLFVLFLFFVFLFFLFCSLADTATIFLSSSQLLERLAPIREAMEAELGAGETLKWSDLTRRAFYERINLNAQVVLFSSSFLERQCVCV